MMVWESVTYFIQGLGHDDSKRIPRKERRRIEKHDWKRRRDRDDLFPILFSCPFF